MNPQRLALAISLFAVILASATVAGAQPAVQESRPTQAQIVRYAAAIVDLNAIQARYDARLEASTADARVELEAEISERMLAAVRRHNLDRRTFNRISASVRADPQLAQQVRNHIGRQTFGF